MTKPKTVHISQSNATADDYHESGLSTLARIVWMLLGNVVLVFLALSIYRQQAIFTVRDIIYWGIVLLLIIVRYCDIKYLGGRTAQGQPASIIQWRKYAIFLLLIAGGVWLLVHGLAFLNK